MNNVQIDKNSKVPFERKALSIQIEYLQDMVIDNKNLADCLKFHQKTSWHFPFNWEVSAQIQEWLQLVEFRDIIPDSFENKISFDVDPTLKEEYTSFREFSAESVIEKNSLGKILYNAFGRAHGVPTKPYPSAGGLYPIIPLVMIFNNNIVSESVEAGCYVFDSTNIELLQIKKFDKDYISNISKNINNEGKLVSDIAIGYALDIRRAITKYGIRGYRHGLIEVGLMAQSFRHALTSENEWGDCCWSGFNDNALTNLLGLNPRLAPLILIQWFGKKG